VSLPSPSAPADGSLQQGLHQDGRRLTPQRKRVLELFEHRGSGCHLSAEEVHQQLASLQLKVSLATVYRTLRLLADMGFLQELELTKGAVALSWPRVITAITTMWCASAADAPKNLKVSRC
jgi:Fur family ferric uptake transcriptional regulator